MPIWSLRALRFDGTRSDLSSSSMQFQYTHLALTVGTNLEKNQGRVLRWREQCMQRPREGSRSFKEEQELGVAGVIQGCSEPALPGHHTFYHSFPHTLQLIVAKPEKSSCCLILLGLCMDWFFCLPLPLAAWTTTARSPHPQ